VPTLETPMSPGGSQASAGEGLSPCNIGIGIGKLTAAATAAMIVCGLVVYQCCNCRGSQLLLLLHVLSCVCWQTVTSANLACQMVLRHAVGRLRGRSAVQTLLAATAAHVLLATSLQ